MSTFIDKNERCAICGLPRHAHWYSGGFPPVAAGRCSGFQSDVPEGARDQIRAILDQCDRVVADQPDVRVRAAEYSLALDRIRELIGPR